MALISIALPKQLLSFEPSLPIVYTSIWAGSSALEILSLFSHNVQHMIYGNKPVNEPTKDALKGVLNPLNLDIPVDIHESRSILPTFAGKIFNNHDSLFISKETLEQIEAGTPLNDQTKEDLITAALMIENNCDAKVLLAFIAAPIAVWTSFHYLNALLEKIKASESEKPWMKKIASIVAAGKESFRIKALIALSLTGAFTLCQRHAINNQAAALLL